MSKAKTEQLKTTFSLKNQKEAIDLIKYHDEEALNLSFGTIDSSEKLKNLCANLNNTTKNLILDFSNDILISELCENLNNNKIANLEELSLRGMKSLRDEITELKALKNLPKTLRTLALSNNFINTPEKINELNNLDKNIKAIHLSYNGIKDYCAESLINLLKKNHNILFLNVSHNRLSQENIDKIDEQCRINQTTPEKNHDVDLTVETFLQFLKIKAEEKPTVIITPLEISDVEKERAWERANPNWVKNLFSEKNNDAEKRKYNGPITKSKAFSSTSIEELEHQPAQKKSRGLQH